ncbi:hypothetical protein [Spongiimicrobium salis]|uniref:hypothetical protein n=1 Tax=Spongiimicrobium salis TaxID=1667022 RepID=UPI00374D829F
MKEVSKDIQLFQLLLKQVNTVFLKTHASSHKDISQWKGEDITRFQEDLRDKTQSSVSEKWFYSYVKNQAEKLPRIDILNVLSRYVGFENWHAFRQEHHALSGPKNTIKTYWMMYIGGMLLIGILGYAFINTNTNLHFCFQDMDTGQAITRAPIDIIVLKEGESPSYHKTDSLGCFSYTTTKKHVRFIAQSPYYKTDTIYREVSSETLEPIRLRTDDYALMLHYYGNSNVKDWKKRREELEHLLADDAIIFEVLPGRLGVERHRKKAFINILTTPTQRLKNLRVLKTEYRRGKIVKLKFRIAHEN